jgi:hypothetical protein
MPALALLARRFIFAHAGPSLEARCCRNPFFVRTIATGFAIATLVAAEAAELSRKQAITRNKITSHIKPHMFVLTYI